MDDFTQLRKFIIVREDDPLTLSSKRVMKSLKESAWIIWLFGNIE